VANAGKDTIIYLPADSVLLNGENSGDPDGTITSFQWKKIAGPSSFSIPNTGVAKSIVINLVEGVYQFELKVTDNDGLSAKDTVQVTVNKPVNQPPVADAGPDQDILLPTNIVNLDGSASSDPDNNIISYQWKKIAGPSSFAIVNTNTAQTQVTNLIEGNYLFELTVTDTKGLFDKDTVQVKVYPAINPIYYGNICFYFPDPTGTIAYPSVWFGSPVPSLIIVSINNLSDTLSGVWGKNYSPTCRFSTDYYIEPGANCVFFDLAPGTYSWNATSPVLDLTGYPLITPSFIQYCQSPHACSGTITVNPGDSCIIQPIVFP
jgi:hypothetical protein